MSKIIITGAAGNLGVKLIAHLTRRAPISEIVGVDCQPPSPQRNAQLKSISGIEKFEFVRADLRNWNDLGWRDRLADADAVVHFAAQNPYPEATWTDANASLDMTMNVALAAVDAGIRRFVFTSSNHVMGRYKDKPLAATVGPGDLTPQLPQAVGTIWHTGDRLLDSTIYAVAKSSGERLCHTLADRASGRTSFVCVRVGWCQPDQNLPTTLSAAGTPTQQVQTREDADWQRADRWFKQMWLSNRDFTQLFEKAIYAEHDNWPGPCLVVNGMSANTRMKWSLANARELLDYEPVDDACPRPA